MKNRQIKRSDMTDLGDRATIYLKTFIRKNEKELESSFCKSKSSNRTINIPKVSTGNSPTLSKGKGVYDSQKVVLIYNLKQFTEKV